MIYTTINSIISTFSALPANVKSMSVAVPEDTQPFAVVTSHGVDAQGNATQAVSRYFDLRVPSVTLP